MNDKKTIDTTHPRYNTFIKNWQKARDFYEGEEQVKSKGETYLPRSNDVRQQGEDRKYQSYKSRAFFYEATSRTVEGLVGIATHKPLTIELPTSMSDPDDYIPSDTTIDVLVQDIIRENIITARQGLLIDRINDSKPYIVQYNAEQITNWHYDGDNLVFVVLKEGYNEYNEEDPYNTSEGEQYRELRMIDGVYTQRIWRKKENVWTAGDDIIPTNRGKTMDHIPFIFTSRAKLGSAIDKSPIMGMVNSNCHHYQLNADYAHALHYVACPTLAMYGADESDEDVVVGSDQVLEFTSTDAKAEYVEVKGNGIPSIKTSLDSMEDHMANLGSRLLGSRPSGVESAEAIRLTQSAETSSLMTVVMVAEQALQAAFAEILQWDNVNGEAQLELNHDFVDVSLTPQQISALIEAYQANIMSLDTLLYNLQRGELHPEDVSIEDEKDLIAAGAEPVVDEEKVVEPTEPVVDVVND